MVDKGRIQNARTNIQKMSKCLKEALSKRYPKKTRDTFYILRFVTAFCLIPRINFHDLYPNFLKIYVMYKKYLGISTIKYIYR